MYRKYQNEDLLKKDLSQGIEDGFEFVVNHYYNSLYHYAYSLFKNEAEAKDLVQVCFIKLWDKRKNASSIFNIKSYLYRSIYNGFIDQKRKKREHISIEEKHAGELLNWIEDSSTQEIQDKKQALTEAIQTLPERCRETFKLSKLEGLDYHEIATYMGVSIKTVEAQMVKAYKILREKLCPKKRFSSNIFHNKRIEK